MRYMEALYHVEGDLAWTGEDSLRLWAEYTCQNHAWVEGLGGKIRLFATRGEHQWAPDWECIKQWQFIGSGLGLHRFLTSLVAQRDIRVLYDTPAQNLLTDLNGRVVGVRVAAGKDGRPMDIRAHRAVIMTTGGFEFNETMKLNYLKVYPTYFHGTPANTGDGHRMVMEVGADLWHMNCCSARLVAKFPNFPIAFSFDFAGKNLDVRRMKGQTSENGKAPAGYIIVDRDGRRFTSENFKTHTLYYELAHYDSHRCRYSRIPCFWVFDRRRMEGGALPDRLAGAAGPAQLYQWGNDNQPELEKGWIVQGENVRELAEKLEIPSDNLVDAVSRHNTCCQQGYDPEFHRRPSDLVPLDYPPFYAVRLYPGGPNTLGGPRRDYRARVLNVDGDPIPRLYAAGEFGSIYGMLYPASGANIAECIAFGRIAAENAVREKPLLTHQGPNHGPEVQ